MKPLNESICNLTQVGNSNKPRPPTFTEKLIAIFMVLAIIELVLFASKVFGYISAKEYDLFSVALPIIIPIGLSPLLCRRLKPCDKRMNKWYRIEHGLNAELLPYLSIRGTPRNALPAWLLSTVLIAVIIWRIDVDSILVRKVLCATILGLVSVVCGFIGVVICRMRITITFKRDKFCVFRSNGLGGRRQKEFAYEEWCELRPSRRQGQDVSVFTLVGVKGDCEILNCIVPNSQALAICAYVNGQISNHQASRKSLEKRTPSQE